MKEERNEGRNKEEQIKDIVKKIENYQFQIETLESKIKILELQKKRLQD